MKKQENKIVIFDWGGVVESHDENEYSCSKAVHTFHNRFGIDLKDAEAAKKYRKVHKWKTLEPEKWFEKLKEEFNLQCSLEEFHKAHDEEYDKIHYYKDVVEFAHSLKNYCYIGILSNLKKWDKVRIDKQMNLNKFDYVWLSFELRCEKPHRKIYEIVANEIPDKKILFIDDHEENLVIPKEMGWQTLQATGHELDKIKTKVFKFINN